MLIRPGHPDHGAPFAGVAFKGGEGGSKSSSSSDTKDQRNAIGGSGLVAGQGSTINFKIENPDGWRELLATGAGLFEANLEFAAHQAEMAYETVREGNRSEEQHLGLSVLKSAAPILLVVGLGMAMIASSSK